VVFHVIAAVLIVQWSLGVLLRADVAVLVALYSLVLHGRLGSLLWAAGPLLAAIGLIVWRVSAAVSVWDALFFLSSAAHRRRGGRFRGAHPPGPAGGAAASAPYGWRFERDQRSMLAAAAERARIARETHDIVGHSLSVIITLADGGAYAAGVTPERAGKRWS